MGFLHLFAFQPDQYPFVWDEQSPQYSLRHFTTDDGLPIDTIHDVLPHSDGYLYLATFGGLVRYDGHHFKVYNTANTPALKRNRIFYILPASDDGLWITDTSYNLYLFKEDKMTQFQKYIHDGELLIYGIRTDPENRLLVFTNEGAWQQTADTSFVRLDSVSYTPETVQEFADSSEPSADPPSGLTIHGQPVSNLESSNEITKRPRGKLLDSHCVKRNISGDTENHVYSRQKGASWVI